MTLTSGLKQIEDRLQVYNARKNALVRLAGELQGDPVKLVAHILNRESVEFLPGTDRSVELREVPEYLVQKAQQVVALSIERQIDINDVADLLRIVVNDITHSNV
jgi:hypothetical protein